MLEPLRRIVQDVNEAPDLESALGVIVHQVKRTVGADVCSVYLADFETQEHVLQATDGLRPEAVGRVRLSLNAGLIGFVSKRSEPLNIDNASSHPHYQFRPETGEDQFRGFLAAPIIQHRRALGVLVLRKRSSCCFADDEVTLVLTLAAQLAGAITHARASGELARLHETEELPNRFIQGLPASSGIAIGTSLVVYPPADLDAVPDRPVIDIEREEAAFRDAVADVVEELERFAHRTGSALRAEDRVLFDAWLLMLESDTLIGGVVALIREGNWAPGALRQVVEEHAKVFDAMEDPYLSERGSEVRELGRRVLMHLQDLEVRPVSYGPDTIIVGEEVSAMQIASVPQGCLAGIVSTTGSSSSHVAILARGIGVPAVMGVSDLPVGRLDGLEMVVDGYRGRVYVAPGPAVRSEYLSLQDDDRALSDELQSLRHVPSRTPDGYRLPLYLNTGLASELRPVGIEESAGVGLYRTELPFLVRDRFPGESVQAANYRQVLETFAPRLVNIRTLDVGGDKPLPYFPLEESNPFLGWRGIRITLDHPEIFLTQVRAMLRASVGLDNLRLLLPMIGSVGEVDESKRLIQRARDELLEEGFQVKMPPLGVMIEVPSAVFQAEEIARRVDFVSVGTNDLTQYLLAVDRNNSNVAKLYDELHPSVLRALMQIVSGAVRQDREVSICGEMAGNPMSVVLLLGMGVSSLSMGAGSLLRIKWVIRSVSRKRAQELLSQALELEDAESVRLLLMNALDELGLGSLVRPGK